MELKSSSRQEYGLVEKRRYIFSPGDEKDQGIGLFVEKIQSIVECKVASYSVLASAARCLCPKDHSIDSLRQVFSRFHFSSSIFP